MALAVGGLLLLEHNPASAASAPRVLHTSHAAVVLGDQASHLDAVSSQLRGAASVITQTLPNLDATTAAKTADVAASATHAAALSQQLRSMATSRSANAASTNSTAAALRTALAETQAKSAAVAALPVSFPFAFCNFTIQIGPIIINVPAIGLHLVIGPFFVHFRAPCFLSGRIPTHIPR